MRALSLYEILRDSSGFLEILNYITRLSNENRQYPWAFLTYFFVRHVSFNCAWINLV